MTGDIYDRVGIEPAACLDTSQPQHFFLSFTLETKQKTRIDVGLSIRLI